MIEVAELSATHRKLACVINEYKQRNNVICGEPITNKELEELRCAQKIIKCLVSRQGVPVFNDLNKAMNCVSDMIKEHYSTDQLIRDLKQNYYTKYLKFSDKILRLREIFRSLDVSGMGRISLIDAKYAVRAITGFDITDEVLNSIKFCQLNGNNDYIDGENGENDYNMLLNFEQFFCLIAIYDFELEQLNFKHSTKMPTLKENNKRKNALTVNNSNNIVKPIQKVIDWFSSVTNQPNRHNRQSLHLKNNENLNNVVRRSSSINRLNKLNDNYYNNSPFENGSKSKYIQNQNSLNNYFNSMNGEDEVDFICNTVKNNYLNNCIKTKSVYPFQVECRDIYLGGTCFPSKWREDISIPLLR